jgi:hypothetical protein
MSVEIAHPVFTQADGTKLEKYATRFCSCGTPVEVVGPLRRYTADRWKDEPDGTKRRIPADRWSVDPTGPPDCTACSTRRNIPTRFPEIRMQTFERGVRREDVQAAVDHNEELGSSIGLLVAEVFDEILARNPGDRIKKSVMREHRFAQQIEPIIVNLSDDASPEDALFQTGPVRWGLNHGMISGLVKPAEIEAFLDRHCRGDFGELGRIPAGLSDRAVFARVLATEAETARLAIDSGHGLVRSSYESSTEWGNAHEPARQVIYKMNVWTFIDHGNPSTTMIAEGSLLLSDFDATRRPDRPWPSRS